MNTRDDSGETNRPDDDDFTPEQRKAFRAFELAVANKRLRDFLRELASTPFDTRGEETT